MRMQTEAKLRRLLTVRLAQPVRLLMSNPKRRARPRRETKPSTGKWLIAAHGDRGFS